MIKLIATDMDGTLLNSELKITEQVKATLREAKEKGVKVVLCTGRPLKGVQRFLEELDLVASDQYVITYNGTLVQTTDGSKTIVDYGVDLADVIRVKNFAKEHNTFYHAIDIDTVYTTNQPVGRYTEHESFLSGMPITVLTEEELETIDTSFKKVMLVDESEVLDKVIPQLPADFSDKFYMVKSAPFYLEMLHPLANKGSGLKGLADYLGIAMENVMAIGDNYNDVDMLKIAGMSVAMGNAEDGVKQYANFITKTNDEDGVAYAVKAYL